MPVRIRKTFKILPGVKMNLSKSGVSFTVGTKGYHLNFSKRGVKQTVGLPGSGISQSSYIIKNDSKSESTTKEEKDSTDDTVTSEENERDDDVQSRVVARRRTPGWVLLVGVLVIYLGALVLNLIPSNFLSQVLDTLTEWTRQMGL